MSIEETIRRIVREEITKSDHVCATRSTDVSTLVRETLARALADVSRAAMSDRSMTTAVRAQAKAAPSGKGVPRKGNYPEARNRPKRKKRKHPPRVSEKPANRLKQLFDKMKAGDEFTLTAGEIAKSLGAPVKAVAQALTQGAGLQKTRTGAAFPSNKPDGMEIVKGESNKTVGGAHRWTIRRTA